MSRQERLGPSGKDIVIYATKEDHATPCKIELPESQPSPGLILPNGDINWNCPCLGGMATGPCGVQFRDAFSCFHYSGAEPKGSDCYEQFSIMQECMSKYPELYNKDDDDDDFDLDEAMQQAEEESSGKAGKKSDAANKSDQATKV